MTSTGLLGIDVGTGSVKAVVVDLSGRQVAVAARPYPVEHPRSGWAEVSPEAWWTATRGATRDAVATAGAEIVSIGLSGQMHGVVLSRADGTALRPAILWADQRAEAMLGRYAELAAALRDPLGNPIVAGMTGPLLCWLADNEADVYRRADWALQAKDWLRLRLTGEAGSEPSDASGTLLYDLAGRRWAASVVDALGLRSDLLPPLGRAAQPAGLLSAEAAGALGLTPGLPVAYGAGDTAAALVGTSLAGPGALQLTVGTAAQIVALREEPGPDPDLRYQVFAAALDEAYYALAAVQAAGLAFEWAWQALGCDWSTGYASLERSPPGANGVSFIPHVAGARSPAMNARATGAFVGLELRHQRDDLVRSVFEGVAFSILEAASVLPEGDSGADLRLAGGGTRRPAWRQLLADVLERRLLVVEVANASARGAALLGGMAAGYVPEVPEAPAIIEVVRPRDRYREPYGDAYARWRERAQRQQ
ncbi:MAG: xylulokinase [Acidimicrobiales bacterium]